MSLLLLKTDSWYTAVLHIILNTLRQGTWITNWVLDKTKDLFLISLDLVMPTYAKKKKSIVFRNIACFSTEKCKEKENYHKAESRFNKMRFYDRLMTSAQAGETQHERGVEKSP